MFSPVAPFSPKFSLPAYPGLLEIQSNDCVLCFLDNDLVVKQVKDSNPDEQFLLVLDASGCAIAESIDLPINRVKIIPPNSPFPGKKETLLPATLHTRVPGASIPESDLEVQIHQRVRKANQSDRWPLAPEQEGLNPSIIEELLPRGKEILRSGIGRQVPCHSLSDSSLDPALKDRDCVELPVQNMAMHEDLPGIVALDTFVGNADRSQPNLFYDPSTKRYFGIDLAASFCSALGNAACVQIRRFTEQKKQFSMKELEGLIKYTNTLEKLLSLWSPGAIENLLLENSSKAGFEKCGPLWNRDVEERIIFHRKMIQSNHASIVELVQLLKLCCFPGVP